MNQTVKNSVRRSIRALMDIAPVRHVARRIAHHGIVPDAREQHRNYACVPVEKRARLDAMCRSS